MAKLSILKGATSVLVRIFLQDSSSTTGAGLTGLTNASSGLTCYRMRDDDGNAGATAISLASATLGTWTSGGFKEKDATNAPGWYEFGVTNASLATGSRSVSIHFKGATNLAPLALEIELTGFDNQSVTDGGLSKLSSLTFTVSNKIDANVYTWNGTAVATPATAGIPDVNAKNIGGTAQTGRDIGASVLLSAGTGTGQLDFTSGVVKANATQWLGGTIPAVNVTGVPLVDAKYLLGTIFSTPATAGIMDVNAKNWGNSVVTGMPMPTYTQPTGFLAATFPSGTIANTTNITAGTITTVTTLTNLPSIPANWLTAAGIAAAALNGKGDWSTYAGGDTSGTTTLLGRLTSGRATNLDNLDATVSTRLATTGYTAPDNTSITAIKAQTDKLTFTVSNVLDANVRYVNSVIVKGVGTVASPWGPGP